MLTFFVFVYFISFLPFSIYLNLTHWTFKMSQAKTADGSLENYMSIKTQYTSSCMTTNCSNTFQ